MLLRLRNWVPYPKAIAQSNQDYNWYQPNKMVTEAKLLHRFSSYSSFPSGQIPLVLRVQNYILNSMICPRLFPRLFIDTLPLAV